MDLTIAAGETVAMVGHTGSGKTTLVNLIPRLFDPSRGLSNSEESMCGA